MFRNLQYVAFPDLPLIAGKPLCSIWKIPMPCPVIWSVLERFMWIWQKSAQLITDVSQRIRSAVEDRSEHYSAWPGRSRAHPPGDYQIYTHPTFQERADITQKDMLSLLGSPDRECRKAKEGGEEEGKRREGWRGCWEGSLKNSERH